MLPIAYVRIFDCLNLLDSPLLFSCCEIIFLVVVKIFLHVLTVVKDKLGNEFDSKLL